MANIDWHDFKGGEFPAGTQWVQFYDGETGPVSEASRGVVIRYYGPAPIAAEPEPILPIPRGEWESVAAECVDAILSGVNVYIQHPDGYERCGLGIPAKRGENNCHEYRPIVVLEWIDQMVKAAK